MAKLTKEEIDKIEKYKEKKAMIIQIEKLQKEKTVLQAKISRIDKKISEILSQLETPSQS